MRECPNCSIVKSPEEFTKWRKHCRSCKQFYDRAYKASKKDHIKKSQQDYAKNNPHRHWATGSIRNHKKLGILFLFTRAELEDLAKDTPCCLYCGVLLDWSYGEKTGPSENSPSLDNKDLKTALRLDDIDLVCYRCNRTKADRTTKGFLEYCLKVIQASLAEPEGRIEDDKKENDDEI